MGSGAPATRDGRTSETPSQPSAAIVDIYFAPQPPADKESNWVPTSAKGKFEALFRFYGPEKPVFERTWRLPDIERITP